MSETSSPLLSKTTQFQVPSGFKVTIRETDGNDEEVISKMKDINDGNTVPNFLSGIIMGVSYKDGKLSPSEIDEWKVRDKYFVLLKSRIFSLGSEISYKNKCRCGEITEYDEDLSLYDVDFSKSPEEGKEPYKYAPIAYTNGLEKSIEFTISDGTKFRYYNQTGTREKRLLKINEGELSKNTELTIRDLEWFKDDKWQKITNFKFLSSRKMSEIRNNIKANDLPFEAITECICPKCNTINKSSLISQPDFFFPGEIL